MRALPAVGFLLSLVTITLHSGCAENNQYQAPPPPAVTVATPLTSDAPQFIVENGQTESVESAIVQARVVGELKEIRFEPGAEVNIGDTLYIIEQDEYIAAQQSAQAALEGANANLAAATANIAVAESDLFQAGVATEKAKIDFDRQTDLLANDATARSNWEQAKVNYEQAQATESGLEAAKQVALSDELKAKAEVSRATADLARADLDFGYTEVKAPISGFISETDVKLGNQVAVGTQLATIVKRAPIWAYMNVSETLILDLAKTREAAGGDGTDIMGEDVSLKRQLDEGFPINGVLDYYEQTGFDQDTGTIRIRAVFDNEDGRLIPGLFVRVRIKVGVITDAMLIPEQAIGRDLGGTYVLVVDGENKVDRKIVMMGPKFGDMVAIESGLEPTDKVVIEGLQRARPGATVNPETKALTLPEELVKLLEDEQANQPETTPQ